ncbi:MAG: DNA repair protein RecO [Nitrospinota bacterium]|nr:DNA repair protein RecO [Nitrospinota bacterium]
MPLYETKAIVLKVIDYGESDCIASFFTKEYGKIQGIVKRVRNKKAKFGASLEPFTLSNIIFFGRENANLYNVNSADIVDPFSVNRDDYDKLIHSFYLVDLLNTYLSDRDPHPSLFDLGLETLKSIGEATGRGKTETAINIFQLKFLSESGYAPKMGMCVICGDCNLTPYGFHPGRGGVICRGCMSRVTYAIKVSPGILKFMERAMHGEPHIIKRMIISKEMNGELRYVIEKYLRLHTGRELKSSKFINSHLSSIG